jgi:hypothetical protein
MSKQTVTLTLEVPKGVIDFLTDLFKLGCIEETPEKFLEAETVNTVKSILGDLPNHWFDERKILERYGLDEE